MKNLNKYINEAWSGVKRQTNNAEIEAWCNEMGVENYTINDKGEIDVNGSVWLDNKDFKELPYKFGKVNGIFSFFRCKNLTSLKNCPDKVGGYFSCSECTKLYSLEGCPKEVKKKFYCYNSYNKGKKQFNAKDVLKYCNVDPKKIISKTAWSN